MPRFNFADYLRFKETSRISRDIEKQKKEELDRLMNTNEKNNQLRKIYGTQKLESKVLPTQINFNPFLYKKLKPSAPIPRHPDPNNHNTFNKLLCFPTNKERNHFNIKIDTKKRPVENDIYFSKDIPSHIDYEMFKKSKYIYTPLLDLPAMGWIQKCILCSNLTSSIEDIYPYKLHCCNRCQKKYSEKRKLRKASLIAIESNNFHLYQ